MVTVGYGDVPSSLHGQQNITIKGIYVSEFGPLCQPQQDPQGPSENEAIYKKKWLCSGIGGWRAGGGDSKANLRTTEGDTGPTSWCSVIQMYVIIMCLYDHVQKRYSQKLSSGLPWKPYFPGPMFTQH